MTQSRTIVWISLWWAALALGCQPKGPAPTAVSRPNPYYGPTERVSEVVSAINQNNADIPTLWARLSYYEATLIDDKGQSHFVNGDGALLYRRPQGMRLICAKPAVGTICELGSTNERYWMIVKPEVDTFWWGDYRNLGKPCVKPMPIQPNMVLEVLGVALFNTNLLEPPAPVMRFNPDADAYTFVWSVPLPDRWAAVKEIWYDRQTKLPRLVLLFDANGRVVLRARLSKHEPVEVEDVSSDRWPKVATKYDLFFPDTGAKMSLELSDVVLDKNGSPSRRGIAFPDPATAGVGRTVRLDEACGD